MGINYNLIFYSKITTMAEAVRERQSKGRKAV